MSREDNSFTTCATCVMDSTDPNICFDERGCCNFCRIYYGKFNIMTLSDTEREKKFQSLITKIKHDGGGNEYDCVIGVSGGVDSTFLAYKIKEVGLRPLAVHFDNGWNSELAVHNIEKMLKKLEIDLHTYVVNWEEFKNLQLSFLKASIPNPEIPTDHGVWATLYHTAYKKGIKYILGGSNAGTEGIMPYSWVYDYRDLKLIKGINKKLGTGILKNFPRLSLLRYIFYVFVKKISYIPILNYMDYNKKYAMDILEKQLGWEYYGGKHYESIFTRFIQGYMLPKKFNIDKRKAHLSSLICSGQITREEAVDILKTDPYQSNMRKEDEDYVIKKLEITKSELEYIMTLQIKTINDYQSNYLLLKMLKKLKHYLNN